MECDKKVYKIIISSEANDRMADHFEFLARVNPDAASKLLDELLKDIRSSKPICSFIRFITARFFRSANIDISCQIRDTVLFTRLSVSKCLWTIYKIVGKMRTKTL